MSAVVQATAAKSGGITSLFGLGSGRVNTPLSEPLPTVPSAGRDHAPVVQPELVTSTLSNGVRIAASETASPVLSVALFAPLGSAYETDEVAGASKALEKLAFRATANRTTFSLFRELEKIGASPVVSAGREVTSFALSATKLNTAEAVELLLDSVLNAKLAFHEVRDVLETSQAVVADLLQRPEAVLAEVAHRAAFDGGLSQPLLVDPSILAALTAEKVREYLSSRLLSGGLLLAAVGPKHADLLQFAQPLLEDVAASPSSGAAPPPASHYLGGALSVLSATAPLTHTLLAFEARGGYSNVTGEASALVVAALLREGGLAAQPTLPHGKLSGDVLRSLQPFTATYQRTGLVGAIASSTPSSAGAALDALSKRVEALATGVTEAALRQAKSHVLAEYRATAGTSAGLLQLVGRSLSAGGAFDMQALPSAVEAVTGDTVKSYLAQLLKSPPTLVTYGSLASLPRYDAIVKRFK